MMSSHRKRSPKVQQQPVITDSANRMIWVAICMYVAIIDTPVNGGIREFDSNKAIDIYTPPSPFVWNLNRGFSVILKELSEFTEGSDYMGLLLAGRAEFPWLVDVRRKFAEQEDWASGNLINSQWVLTTCTFLQNRSREGRNCDSVDPSDLSVLFCTNYIYEDYWRYTETGETSYHLINGSDSSGTRIVEKIVIHPKCNCFQRYFDAMLLKLRVPISPHPPLTIYAPFYAVDPVEGKMNLKLVYEEFENQATTNMVCYVASFGREYINNPSPLTLNYKVKYRAYFTRGTTCLLESNYLKHLCAKNGEPSESLCERLLSFSYFGFNGPFMCFRTYASHGAVCEHDHGAPLVCNGKIYGFVIRGVEFLRCNNRRPFPFIVSKHQFLNGSNFASPDDTQFARIKCPVAQPFYPGCFNF